MSNIYEKIMIGIRHKYFARKNKTPITLSPTSVSDGPQIHLGCGQINIQGWINIDARSMPHVHITTTDLFLPHFTENSIAEIYLSHVLEHFSFSESQDLLKTYFEKLRPGGCLRLAVPDFRVLAAIYKETNDLDKIRRALMGGQDYEFNFNKSVYDQELLKELMENNGFCNINQFNVIDDFGTDIGDWSTRKMHGMPVSLNLKGYKPISASG